MTPDERIDALESRIAELQKEHAAKIDELLEFFERQAKINETFNLWMQAQNEFLDKIKSYIDGDVEKVMTALRRMTN